MHGEKLKSLHLQFPWSANSVVPKYTGAHSTRQRITRQCVWSRAVLPVALSQRATQNSDKRALIKGKRRQTQTDVRARAEHRMTTRHRLHHTGRHQRALSIHRRAPTVSSHLRSQSSGCTDHPPASPIHYCCDAHSLVVVRTRQWNRNIGTQQAIMKVVETSYTAVLC